MIDFEKYTLDNGLRVIVHHDPNTPIAAVNTLYDVGARDEVPGKTGFAHLFEHLMFGGSRNIPNFDAPLQRAGGQNNAFTNNDFTNYYITLPKNNLDTALWLESDRMLGLAFTEHSLEVQRKVVIEEFQQRYLNQPYGDLWLTIRPMAYEKHPYRWATIGERIEHIEEANMDEVRAFFEKFYSPSNAILSIGASIPAKEVLEKVKYWYGDIPLRKKPDRNIPAEPEQKEFRSKTLVQEVPQNAMHLAWHMPARTHEEYCHYDLLSDLLATGKSSRFYRKLIKENKYFTQISAFVLGSLEPGLFMISGMLSDDTPHEKGKKATLDAIAEIASGKISESELEKVKNRIIANQALSETNVLSKTMNLAYYDLLGDANLINSHTETYLAVTVSDIEKTASHILSSPYNELIYKKKNG